MTIGVWVLGDQLWAGQSGLESCLQQHQQTPVIFIESLAHAGQLPYHLQKLVLVWSAMRHFATELRSPPIVLKHLPEKEIYIEKDKFFSKGLVFSILLQ